MLKSRGKGDRLRRSFRWEHLRSHRHFAGSLGGVIPNRWQARRLHRQVNWEEHIGERRSSYTKSYQNNRSNEIAIDQQRGSLLSRRLQWPYDQVWGAVRMTSVWNGRGLCRPSWLGTGRAPSRCNLSSSCGCWHPIMFPRRNCTESRCILELGVNLPLWGRGFQGPRGSWMMSSCQRSYPFVLAGKSPLLRIQKSICISEGSPILRAHTCPAFVYTSTSCCWQNPDSAISWVQASKPFGQREEHGLERTSNFWAPYHWSAHN